MIDISSGRYWDLPLSLVSGCTPCSPGCDHCWSLMMEKRFHKDGPVAVHPERLSIPMKRRKPTVYAVWNDLFHEAVPDEFRERAYATMELTPHHTYLVITKRAEQMEKFVNNPTGKHLTRDNVYHGLTVCNQQEADEKIPIFLQVPGKKFLSIEPMLGPIDLTPPKRRGTNCNLNDWLEELDLINVGGETGPGARPLHPDWVRMIRDRCADRTDMGRPWPLPFFFKQWGEWEIASASNGHHGSVMPEDGKRYVWIGKNGKVFYPSAPNGQDCWAMAKVGHKVAGRVLDGRTHDDLPWRQMHREAGGK